MPIILFQQLVTTLLIKLKHLPEDFLWDVPISTLVDTQRGKVYIFEPTLLGCGIGPAGLSIEKIQSNLFLGTTSKNTVTEQQT